MSSNCRIISVSNHKGGVAKTTTTLNVSFGLHKLRKKVLMIDLDPQASLSFSIRMADNEKNIYGSICDQYPLTPYEIIKGLDIIPSTLSLANAEMQIINLVARESILKDLIEPLKNDYDYILIDTAPSLGLLNVNALTAATEVLIPIEAEYLSLNGLSMLLDNIALIKKKLNKELFILGILIVKYDHRKVLNRDIAKGIEEKFHNELLNTRIRVNVRLSEAQADGIDIYRYDPKSHGAEDYMNLSKEINKRK